MEIKLLQIAGISLPRVQIRWESPWQPMMPINHRIRLAKTRVKPGFRGIRPFFLRIRYRLIAEEEHRLTSHVYISLFYI